MTWTRPDDLRRQVRTLWDKGALPSSLVGGPELFPRRLLLKGPSRAELGTRFQEVRTWIADLEREAGPYRVVRREINHRLLGANSIPAEVWVDAPEQALALINKAADARRLRILADLAREQCPGILPWLVKRPLRALELREEWPRLLAVVSWLIRHPRPDIYPRQATIPGVHGKFIETHRKTLAELLDLVLPPEAVDTSAIGTGGFSRRYGFRTKPIRIRFRLLDPTQSLLPGPETIGTTPQKAIRDFEQDISLNSEAFARLNLPVRRVFITENETNFLAFPQASASLVLFGAGYGFEMLARAAWLHQRELVYWGDLDTHGFAILHELRTHFPHAVSLLMDRETLLAHRPLWGSESRPETRDLPLLTSTEREVYDDLRWNRLGQHVRLEQELIDFKCLQRALGQVAEGRRA